MNRQQSMNYFQNCDMMNGLLIIKLINYFYMIRIKMDLYNLKILLNIILILINEDFNVWGDLEKLVYNNLINYKLEDLINNKDEFEESIIFNFFELTNLKINKLSLCFNIDEMLIDYLNEKDVMKNLKEINISCFNLKQLIKLNIICPNTEELNLYIYEDDPEINKNKN